MTIGIFDEKFGTQSDDNITVSASEIAYGLQGNDVFSLNPSLTSEDTVILLGGEGDDQYILKPDSFTVILETGSSNGDSLIADSFQIDGDNTFSAVIDDRHIYSEDEDVGTSLLILDWRSSTVIDNFTLAEGNFTFGQVIAFFNQVVNTGDPNFLGNLSWDDPIVTNRFGLELSEVGLSVSNIDADIENVKTREQTDSPRDDDSLLNDTLIRFQNTAIVGTYLFAGEEEAQNVRNNFSPPFLEEGEAFKVSLEQNDDLVRFNRFSNNQVQGTYLYATEEESISIRENFSDIFSEDGIAFYAYGADDNMGRDIIRFRNRNVAGTYLFVLEEEAQSIRQNFSDIFLEEGVAFEVA